jgi:tetratricopeptide (TPR) repeat protein
LDSAHPELSGLVFSLVNERGEPQDGFLRAHEIFNLKLSPEVVVLSACQTAVAEYKFRLAYAYHHLSRRHASLGWAKAEDWKREEAIQSEREAIRILEELTRQDAENSRVQAVLGESYVQLAKKLLWSPTKDERTGKWSVTAEAAGKSEHEAEIVELYQKGISHFETAIKLDPLGEVIHSHLGNAYLELAARQPFEKKQQLVLAGLEVFKQRAASDPKASDYRKKAESALCQSYQDAAHQIETETRFDEAIVYWRKAIDLCTHSTAFQKDDTQHNLYLSSLLMELAATQILKGDLAGAIDSYTQRIELVSKLVDQYERARKELCMTYYWRGKIQSEAGRQEEAVASWRSALEQFEAVEEAKRDGTMWLYGGSSLYQLRLSEQERQFCQEVVDKLKGTSKKIRWAQNFLNGK